MRKMTQREALRRAVRKATDIADKITLEAIIEALTVGSTYDDERNEALVVMRDAGLISKAFPVEQAQAVAARDAQRAAHVSGVNTRNAVAANVAAGSGEASDI